MSSKIMIFIKKKKKKKEKIFFQNTIVSLIYFKTFQIRNLKNSSFNALLRFRADYTNRFKDLNSLRTYLYKKYEYFPMQKFFLKIQKQFIK